MIIIILPRQDKIQDLWMPTPCKVIAEPDDSKAVYTIAPVDGSWPPKNIHRTELRPCGPGIIESSGQDVQSHSKVVSDVEMDDPWVIRGEVLANMVSEGECQSELELYTEITVDQ